MWRSSDTEGHNYHTDFNVSTEYIDFTWFQIERADFACSLQR